MASRAAGGGKGRSPGRSHCTGPGAVPLPTGPAARAPQVPRPSTIPLVLAAVAVAMVAAAWAIPLAQSYAGGIDGVDSMWYHLPQSAVFAQTGSVTDLHFTDPYFLNWYYPAHSELLHAVPMLTYERDWLSPLVNHAFLALGLLAAWCIGRPWGLGPATLIAAAIVFGSEMMIDFQPGEARNDAIGLALFLAAIAIVVNSRSRVAIAFAGLAAGLAIGTKLTLLAPIAALAVAVVALTGNGGSGGRAHRPGESGRSPGGVPVPRLTERLTSGAIFLTATIAGGGFWYVRNLVHSGNPLPWIDELGPISLPAPDVALELRPPFSVAHYATDFDVWREWFAPGLTDSIGALWPIVVMVALGAAIWACATGLRDQRGERLIPALGSVVLVTFLAYLVTPLTASGPEGAPEGFVWNLRYIAPALALGLILLPLLRPLRAPRASLAVSAGLFVVLAIQTVRLEAWDFGHTAWAIGSAALALTLCAAGWWLVSRPAERRPPRPALAAAGAAIALAAIGAGYLEQDRYADKRYANVLDGLHLDEAIEWAKPISDARIATAGRGGVFFQYGFYGDRLTNEVQWLGVPGPRGAWLPIESCERFRQALNDGGYEFVVTTYDRRFPGADQTSREREWIVRDPAVEPLVNDGPVTVYELSGPLDPSGCGARGGGRGRAADRRSRARRLRQGLDA